MSYSPSPARNNEAPGDACDIARGRPLTARFKNSLVILMNSDFRKWIQSDSARLEEKSYDRDEVLCLAFASFRRGYNMGTRQTKYRGRHPFNYRISSDREDGGCENA